MTRRKRPHHRHTPTTQRQSATRQPWAPELASVAALEWLTTDPLPVEPLDVDAAEAAALDVEGLERPQWALGVSDSSLN